MNVTVTPAAEKFIRRLLRFDGGPGSGFRLAVSPGGCSGLAAEFSVESAPKTGDKAVDIGGIPFFLPAESRLLLDGATIDFLDTPLQSGFVFRNANQAGASCGAAKPASGVVALTAGS